MRRCDPLWNRNEDIFYEFIGTTTRRMDNIHIILILRFSLMLSEKTRHREECTEKNFDCSEFECRVIYNEISSVCVENCSSKSLISH